MEITADVSYLGGRWLRVARVIWIILFGIALLIFFTSLPGYTIRITEGIPTHGAVEEPGSGFILLQGVNVFISIASGALSIALSLVLFRRKFENPAVAAVSFYLLLYGAIMTGPLEAWGYYWMGSTDFAINIQALLMATPTVALLALFPNGKFVPGWMRWVLIASVPWNFLAFLYPLNTENIAGLVILGSLWATLLGTGFYAQIFRYRLISTPDERQQTKWVLFGFGLWLGHSLLTTYPYFYLTSLPAGALQPWWAPLLELGWWLSLNIIPVTMAVAITRSRLWNIDIVINRTLVYVSLSVITMAIYILSVGALGNLLNIGDNTFIAFLTTGLVAVLFQPIRERLQTAINRLMYGERDDPVAVITKLGEQIEHTGTTEAALKGIVETVAQTLKLPYVAIELGNSGEIVTRYGLPVYETIRLPLVYQGESVGYFVVAQRAREESFSLKDHQLLENIARQAGAAAHNALLTTDLIRARQRLITTREEERRRIRRDLHDGLGPQLASQTLTLSAARRLITKEPQNADALLAEAIRHAQTATEDVRRLVYDLRPPALDDLGLIGALEAQIQRFEPGNMQIRLSVPDTLPSLPAAVEVACYLISQEALNNVMRHSGASTCKITLSVNEVLHLEIQDNGTGIQSERGSGVGLHSMRQRAQELGGSFKIESRLGEGTIIIVQLPMNLPRSKDGEDPSSDR